MDSTISEMSADIVPMTTLQSSNHGGASGSFVSTINRRRSAISVNADDESFNKPRWASDVQLNEVRTETVDQEREVARSIFTSREKYVIVFLAGMCGFWSTISSPIYLPALPQLETHFKVSEEQINITIVVYSIFQGFSPALFSTFADRFGRRMITMICLIIYTFANVGLAINNSFVGLLLLRCLQAFGIASTISIGSGIASDITLKAERASYIGICTGLSLLGQAFGALIGGLISTGFGWRGIFWFLAIASGITFLFVAVFLPETSRSIVGNGSILPQKMRVISTAPILSLPTFSKRTLPVGKINSSLIQPKQFTILTPFKILKSMPVFLTLAPASICYSLWLMMLTTLSTSLSKSYGYSTTKVAVAYIPSGIGGLVGTVSIGKLLDWSYKTHYNSYLSQKKAGNDIKFNIFKARLVVAILPTFLCTAGSLMVGFAIQYHTNVAIILIGSCIISMGAMIYVTVSTTVLIDLFPLQSSSSSSCVNLARCWTGAVFIAVLSKMEHTMTISGCYAFMAGLCLLSGTSIGYLYYRSEKWV